MEPDGPEDARHRRCGNDGRARADRGRARLVDCLHERLEPADRACDEPAPGAGRACGARGLAWPRGPAPAGRKCSSRDWRRRSGFRPGLDGRRTSARLRGWLLSSHGRNRTRRAGVVAPVGSHGSQRAALRTCAVRARQRRPGGRVLALHGALVYRQRGCQTPATSPRRDSVRNRDAASGRRRAASCQPGRIGARQSGLRHPQPAQRLDIAAGRRVCRAGPRRHFWNELQRRVEALPGVSGVTFADGRPPDDVGNFNNFDLEASPTAPGQSQPVTPWVSVTPEYFGLLGLSHLEGRLFDQRDGLGSNVEVVIVDRAWAKRFFPNESAVGKRFREGGCTTCPWTTVVGVVSDVKYAGLDVPDEGAVYTPMAGRGVSSPIEEATTRFRYLILRTRTDPSVVLPAVRQIVRALDPSLPFSSVATIDDLVAQSLQRPRSMSLLVGGFAAGRAHPFGRRHLRRDGVLRRAAHQGHQHSPGTRRPPDGCAGIDRRSRHEGRLGRSHRRLAGRARADSRDVEPPVRCRRRRCVHIQRRRDCSCLLSPWSPASCRPDGQPACSLRQFCATNEGISRNATQDVARYRHASKTECRFAGGAGPVRASPG